MKTPQQQIQEILEPKNAVDTEFVEDGKEWQGFDVGMIEKENRYRIPIKKVDEVCAYGIKAYIPNYQTMEDFIKYIQRFFMR